MLGDIISAGASLIGAKLSNDSNERTMRQNVQYQKEFAKNGITWKVADAKSAGIHPLAALGANTMAFSPVSIGHKDGIADAGQSLGRAIDAGLDKKARILRDRLLEANVRDAEANALFSEVRVKDYQNNLSNGVPATDDQTLLKPAEVTSRSSNDAAAVAGSNPSVQFFKMGNTVVAAPSEQLAESMEEYPPAKVAFFWENSGSDMPKPTLKEFKKNYPKQAHKIIGMKRVAHGWRPIFKRDKYKNFKRDYKTFFNQGLQRENYLQEN